VEEARATFVEEYVGIRVGETLAADLGELRMALDERGPRTATRRECEPERQKNG